MVSVTVYLCDVSNQGQYKADMTWFFKGVDRGAAPDKLFLTYEDAFNEAIRICCKLISTGRVDFYSIYHNNDIVAGSREIK